MSKAIIENGLSINIHHMVMAHNRDKRVCKLPLHCYGSLHWMRAGKRIGSISYTLDQTVPDSARLELCDNALEEHVKYSMALTARPCRFGGLRWFAICPRTGLIVSKLHQPRGAEHFLARQAYRVAYQSQCDAAGLDRAINRRSRVAMKKLKSDDPHWPLRPKWMRWKTYEKHLDRIAELDSMIDTAIIRRFAHLAT